MGMAVILIAPFESTQQPYLQLCAHACISGNSVMVKPKSICTFLHMPFILSSTGIPDHNDHYYLDNRVRPKQI